MKLVDLVNLLRAAPKHFEAVVQTAEAGVVSLTSDVTDVRIDRVNSVVYLVGDVDGVVNDDPGDGA